MPCFPCTESDDFEAFLLESATIRGWIARDEVDDAIARGQISAPTRPEVDGAARGQTHSGPSRARRLARAAIQFAVGGCRRHRTAVYTLQ
jgi:hypothetical protein